MITGRCCCGAVRFECASPPTDAGHCHCQTCQRVSGGPYMTWVTFDSKQFTVTSGALTERESSAIATRGHCAACGTTMTWQGHESPEQIDISAACFDDPSIIKATCHIWVSHRAPWVEIGDGLPQYPEFRGKQSD